MAKTTAQRQAEYRARRALAGEDNNGAKRISTWVSTSTTLALCKLAKRDGVTQGEIIERLVKIEDDAKKQEQQAVSQSRIHELESALKDVIGYLHRLPLNPETRRIADEAQQVIDNDNFLSILTASSHTPAGIQLIDVKIKGNTVILQAIPVPNKCIAAAQKDELHERLLAGIELIVQEVS